MLQLFDLLILVGGVVALLREIPIVLIRKNLVVYVRPSLDENSFL